MTREQMRELAVSLALNATKHFHVTSEHVAATHIAAAFEPALWEREERIKVLEGLEDYAMNPNDEQVKLALQAERFIRVTETVDGSYAVAHDAAGYAELLADHDAEVVHNRDREWEMACAGAFGAFSHDSSEGSIEMAVKKYHLASEDMAEVEERVRRLYDGELERLRQENAREYDRGFRAAREEAALILDNGRLLASDSHEHRWAVQVATQIRALAPQPVPEVK